MDNVVQYFLDNPQPKYFTLKDIANRNKKSNDLKGEIPRIDYQHLRLGSFRAFMPKDI
ncbi:MAG: hypothetical protein IPH11_04825 [Ignavibacteriales bacterium]|nr:hypothetical protein [Ignavibacteriales bacterium]